MIRFSIYEIMRSVFAAFVFAVVMCLLYEILNFAFHALTIILSKGEYYIYKKGSSIKKAVSELEAGIYEAKSPIWLKYYHFIFTFTFGIIYVIMQYVFCDGVFRVYFLLTVTATFFISKKLFQKYMHRFAMKCVLYFCASVLFLISLLFTPIYITALKLSKKISALCHTVKKIFKTRRGRALFRHK